MMKTYYAVMTTNYSYNDEIYYNESGSAGHLQTLFSTRERAEEEKFKLIKEFFLEAGKDNWSHLNNYAYSESEVLEEGWEKEIFTSTDQKLAKILEKNKHPYSMSSDELKAFFTSLTDEQFKKFIDVCLIQPYFVVPVDLVK